MRIAREAIIADKPHKFGAFLEFSDYTQLGCFKPSKIQRE